MFSDGEKMYLIPQVKKCVSREGSFRLELSIKIYFDKLTNSNLFISSVLTGSLVKILGREPEIEITPAERPVGIYFCTKEMAGPENYTIDVSPERINVSGGGEESFLRAVQTLCQIVNQCGAEIPCLYIEDYPDFPRRGFYHDVTRGRVPQLKTLKWLADKLSNYKINQMQLYMEHTFAFGNIPELWSGKDPLTAEEIKELDKHCRRLHIDLVPSLSTFGHLYELLRLKRFEHLNELDIRASDLPHNLWDRMAHYTIDPQNPESFELIKSMIEEVIPAFSSQFFNICCDETFDLGKGKNLKRAQELGTGRLYVDFVKKVAGVVIDNGKIPMMWGDIVLHYPELIEELPREMIFLNWGYSPDIDSSSTEIFARKGLTQYCCPGLHGWSRFAYDINSASKNIRRMVSHGHSFGAEGILTTDWGDCGHVNLISGSMHGMMLSAALSWNHNSYEDDNEFDRAASVIEWQEMSGRLFKLLRELGSLCTFHFGNIYAWAEGFGGLWNREEQVKEIDIAEISEKFKKAEIIKDQIFSLRDFSVEKYGEFIWGARAVRWTLGLLSYMKVVEYRQAGKILHDKNELIGEGKDLLDDFKVLWKKRNKDSELYEIEKIFLSAFKKIESIDARGLL